MKNIKLIITAILISGSALMGCAQKRSAWRQNPPPDFIAVSQKGDKLSFDFSTKAEIIFVIDNSVSMEKHIANVSRNIDLFVNSFTKNNPIEYNLAVVTVYDSQTYESTEYKEKFKNQPELMHEAGQFRQVKITDSQVMPDKYFISSSDLDVANLLKNTLKVGVQNLSQGGPHFEESFSPLAKIFSIRGEKLSKEVAARQKNFSLGNNSYKIIFFVTDASDNSEFSAAEIYQNLVEQSGGDRSRVFAFGAIVPSDASSSCKRDQAGAPRETIEEFLKLSRQNIGESNILSLCDANFGETFARFGKEVRERTMPKVIPLQKTVPLMTDEEDKKLRVFYGTYEMPMEDSTAATSVAGFRYDPGTNSIHINPMVELPDQHNAKLRIEYTAVHMR